MRYPVRHCIGVHSRSSAFVPILRPLPAVSRKRVVLVPLTDIIEQDLLATLAGDGDPQAVLDRHAGSKGPLYLALARATAQATDRLADVRTQLHDAQAHCRDADEHANQSEKRATQADRRALSAEKRLVSAEAALRKRQALLDRADALQATGFDADALGLLGNALGAAARAEDKPTTEVVAAFLTAAEDWRRLTELRVQVATVEKQAEEAEQRARRRQTEAKLTERAVNAARWLVQHGVTVDTVEAWQAAATKTGITAEALATSLGRALQEHSGLEATRRAWTAAVVGLRAEHARITAEVTALRHEKDGISAAVAAVEEAGVGRLRRVADTADAEVQRVASEFTALVRQAEELRQEVAFAHALRHDEAWDAVEPETWTRLLGQLARWLAGRDAAHAEVLLPTDLQDAVRGSLEYPSLRGAFRIRLAALVQWVTTGLHAVPTRAVSLPPSATETPVHPTPLSG